MIGGRLLEHTDHQICIFKEDYSPYKLPSSELLQTKRDEGWKIVFICLVNRDLEAYKLLPPTH